MKNVKKYLQLAAAVIAIGLSIYDIENIDRYFLGLTTVLGALETFRLKGLLNVTTDKLLQTTEHNVRLYSENQRLTKSVASLQSEVSKLVILGAGAEKVEAEKPKTRKRTTKKKED